MQTFHKHALTEDAAADWLSELIDGEAYALELEAAIGRLCRDDAA